MQGTRAVKQSKGKLVAHIYAFGFTCLLFALIQEPINDGYDVFAILFIAFCVSCFVFAIASIVRLFTSVKEVVTQKLTVETTPQSVSPETNNTSAEPEAVPSVNTGNPKLDEVIIEGQNLLEKLQTAAQSIKNKSVVQETNKMIDTSHKIIEKLKRNPDLLSSAQRFFNYYLPTTTKLVTNYVYMEKQGIEGGNISDTMQKIEASLSTLGGAYKTQLDALFSHTAMDLETDIAALEQVLKKEGLLQNELTMGLHSESKGE